MLISFLAEPALLMVFFTASLISQSTQLPQIVDALAHREFAIYPSMAFAAVAFWMVSVAENARIPVDNPTTHLELTMIHEVMVLDHSGPPFALVLYGASLKLMVLGAPVVRLLLPFSTGSPAGDALLFLGGMLLLAVAIGVIESIMARLRLTRVPQVLIGTTMLSAFALVLVLR
jgi:formate hydrogenlyase subunit 4